MRSGALSLIAERGHELLADLERWIQERADQDDDGDMFAGAVIGLHFLDAALVHLDGGLHRAAGHTNGSGG